jgi:hypothetical protein
MATMAAIANTVAEPVVSVNHQTRANCANPLPKSEKAWAVQKVMKGVFHDFVGSIALLLHGFGAKSFPQLVRSLVAERFVPMV